MTPEKPIIIAIVGDSGSGKTSLSFHLNDEHGIPYICSYTTRPMREGEVNGRDHWYADICVLTPSSTLAYTSFAGYQYWTLTSQIAEGKAYSYVIDEKGLKELEEKWQDKYDIISVYVIRSDKTNIDIERLKRDGERSYISLSDYSLVIYNDQDLQSFLSSASEQIISLINKKQYGTEEG